MTWARRFSSTAVLGLLGVALLPAPAHAEDSTNVTVDLTTTPFNAVSGQRVTHRLVVRNDSQTEASDVKVRFTGTIGLDSIEAHTTRGSCEAPKPQEVVCRLGAVAPATTEAAVITIKGVLAKKRPPGNLVQDVAVVSTAGTDSNPSDDTSITAYLLPPEAAAAKTDDSGGSFRSLGVLAAIVVGTLVFGALWLLRRRRRQAVGGAAPDSAPRSLVPDAEQDQPELHPASPARHRAH